MDMFEDALKEAQEKLKEAQEKAEMQDAEVDVNKLVNQYFDKDSVTYARLLFNYLVFYGCPPKAIEKTLSALANRW